jgi:hypothetical protein
MSLKRTKLVFAMLGSALALPNCGCMAPWAEPPVPGQSSKLNAALPKAADTATHHLQGRESSQPLDLAGVLDKLQQVRAIDPAAEQKLMDELRRTPAESWPLVAEQFRASLAYREQIAAKNLETRRVDQAAAEPPLMERRYGSVEASPARQTLAYLDGRPSAPIGALVDPRKADADGVSSEALAKATPYSTPVAIAPPSRSVYGPPNEFTASGTTSPIARDGVASRHGDMANPTTQATSPVVQARLETVGERFDEQAAQPTGKESMVAESQELDWQQLIKQAADDLNSRVAVSPATTAEVHQHVSLRLLWLLAGNTEKALEPIPHIAPSEQDYWSRQLFALATYLDHHSQPDDKRRAAASVTHLDEAVANLRELGSLTLRNLSFSKNVHGYGAIEPFDGDRFSPGQHVSLYVEVENYHSRSTEKGFCTLLGSSYEVLNEEGERISGGEFPDVEDCCRSRRRDFHVQYGLALPAKIAPGQYQLQLVVKDRQSDKIGHATAAFEIRGNQQ